MKKIKSFTVNHNLLEKGMYVSRIDGDVITYDVRMKKPNAGDYLSPSGMHTLEHLLATFMRNSNHSGSVIYVGPMGCRTGFYVILRETVTKIQAIALVQEGLQFIADFEGEIPGNSKIECGNYKDHNLHEAKSIATDMVAVLHNWQEKDLIYKE